VVEFDGYGLGLRKHKVRDFFRLVKAVEAKSWTGAPLWLVHTVFTTSSCEGNIWKPYPVTVDVSGNHSLCTVDDGTVDAIYSASC
jgi:hypothetical protein